MRVLLDTNIIIHREASKVYNKDIGVLFKWLDRLGYEKWIHHLSILEIEKYRDSEVVQTMKLKIENYNIHKFDSDEKKDILELRQFDKDENDSIDTSILNEVYSDKFDFLLTEDKKLYKKSKKLGIDSKVFNIDSFLEKVNIENPELKDYKTLAVKKESFGRININDPFFDSFKQDYAEFEKWFIRKSETEAYICDIDNNIRAFLFLKVEGLTENYSNILPTFPSKRRLKIGTFKVDSTGFKLGERFLKIIFDNALLYKVDEIYVTIFDKRDEQQRLIDLLEDWGFKYWGIKTTSNGSEKVFIRNVFQNSDIKDPKLTYPIISRNTKKFIVPIYPKYHTDLLPDSILNNESPLHFIENEPYRNAINKVYISRSLNRKINPGDILVFYRTGGYYASVVTTIAIVESVILDIRDENHFIELCRKRSVFNNDELKDQWNYNIRSRPFIVNFLHIYSFPSRINLKQLIDLGVIKDINSAPRGFEPINNTNFEIILKATNTDESFIID
ncbi:MAG: hypothetical protein ACO1O6_01200 [Bacteroidota bacterium]